jgi:hypothetical protein
VDACHAQSDSWRWAHAHRQHVAGHTEHVDRCIAAAVFSCGLGQCSLWAIRPSCRVGFGHSARCCCLIEVLTNAKVLSIKFTVCCHIIDIYCLH